jgi:hypothetical protein
LSQVLFFWFSSALPVAVAFTSTTCNTTIYSLPQDLVLWKMPIGAIIQPATQSSSSVRVLIGINLYMPLDDCPTHMETANDMFLATSKSPFECLRYLSRCYLAISPRRHEYICGVLFFISA